ncbi:MAG: CCA tRNA nucleotidyltransferase [Planctomycetaceae bacterium]|nr:CCA tRNA nucleotidyltransferase [Planctomycetaceae bacterium]
MTSSADPPREFAVSVVRQLRDAGFQALWAGGCVRDALMGKVPKDYDVASNATPDQVIELFGERRTVPVGAAFGVVMVLGPTRAAGQIEVAAFRSDGEYHDGRRPGSVRFCSPAEDAQRRDFTINGMFFDPLDNHVIDFVGGQEDLVAGIVRAIGNPAQRFAEDKLRMLRAVRFAATMGFEIDSDTSAAVLQQHRTLRVVSVERISQELRRMLAHVSRERAFQLLWQTRLLVEVMPELFPPESAHDDVINPIVAAVVDVLMGLELDRFEPALAAILIEFHRQRTRTRSLPPAEIVECVCRRLRLSNDELRCILWLIESLKFAQQMSLQPLHVQKPLLADERILLLIDLLQALEGREGQIADNAAFCRQRLQELPAETLNPSPLLDGRDLQQLGIPPGKQMGRLLRQIRQEQLDELLRDRAAAVQRIQELWSATADE